MTRWTMNVASPKLWVRSIAAAGVVIVTLAWTGILAVISDLPRGYGAAQSRDERWLKDHASSWEEFRHGANHDLSRYIPGYVVFAGLLIVAIVVARRQRGGLVSPSDRLPAIIALAALVAGAVADIVETVLFRRSLTRLIRSSGTAGVATLTSVTRVMTAVKWIGLGVCFVTIVASVLRRPQADQA